MDGGVVNPFAGTWTYRSLLNDPDINKSFNDLEFGVGTLNVTQIDSTTLGGPGWQLDLHGSFGYGRVRTIPHPAGDGKDSGVAPAGVVASFYAVKND